MKETAMDRVSRLWLQVSDRVRARVATEPVLRNWVAAALVSGAVTLGVDLPQDVAVILVAAIFGTADVVSRSKVYPEATVTDGHEES